MAFNKNTQAGMVIKVKQIFELFEIFITLNQWNPDKTGGSDEKKGLIIMFRGQNFLHHDLHA